MGSSQLAAHCSYCADQICHLAHRSLRSHIHFFTYTPCSSCPYSSSICQRAECSRPRYLSFSYHDEQGSRSHIRPASSISLFETRIKLDLCQREYWVVEKVGLSRSSTILLVRGDVLYGPERLGSRSLIPRIQSHLSSQPDGEQDPGRCIQKMGAGIPVTAWQGMTITGFWIDGADAQFRSDLCQRQQATQVVYTRSSANHT